MKIIEKIKNVFFEDMYDEDEITKDFNKNIKPLKMMLELIHSDLILGKITKEKEQEMCKPIAIKIEAFERKYDL